MYILDTNVLIRGVAGKRPDAAFLEKTINKKSVYISVISIAEFLVKPLKGEASSFEELLKISRILEVDERTARQASVYRRKYLKKSRSKLLDNIIAAQAKVHQLTLVTNNTSDFPMKDIKVILPH